MNFSVLQPYLPLFWSGLLTTVEVTGAALVLAFVLGAIIALLKVLPIRWLRALLDFYTSIFRGIPRSSFSSSPISRRLSSRATR